MNRAELQEKAREFKDALIADQKRFIEMFNTVGCGKNVGLTRELYLMAAFADSVLSERPHFVTCGKCGEENKKPHCYFCGAELLPETPEGK